MASSNPLEDKHRMDGNAHPAKKGIEDSFELTQNKDDWYIKYGDTTMAISKAIAQQGGLEIIGNTLATDEDTYELLFKDGKIIIEGMESVDTNESMVTRDNTFEESDGSVTSHKRTKNDSYIHQYKDKNEGQDGLKGESSNSSLQTLQVMMDKYVLGDEPSSECKSFKEEIEETKNSKLQLEGTDITMASLNPHEDKYGMDRFADPAKKGIENSFELTQNKNDWYIKYGNITTAISKKITQQGGLEIVGYTLATDEDTYELLFNGKIIIEGMESDDTNESMVTRDNIFEESDGSVTSHKGTKNDLYIHQYKDKNEGQDGLKGESSHSSLQALHVMMDKYVLGDETSSECKSFKEENEEAKNSKLQLEGTDITMASLNPHEDKYGMDRFADPAKKGIENSFELTQNKNDWYIKYGNITTAISKKISQQGGLEIVGYTLATDEDTYELLFKDGKIIIEGMESDDTNESMVTRDNIFEESDGSVTSHKGTKNDLYIHQYKDKNEGQDGLKGESSHSSLQALHVMMDKYVLGDETSSECKSFKEENEEAKNSKLQLEGITQDGNLYVSLADRDQIDIDTASEGNRKDSHDDSKAPSLSTKEGKTSSNHGLVNSTSNENQPIPPQRERSKQFELYITVKYHYEKEIKEYSTDVRLSHNHETYMKWKYVLNNPEILRKMVKNLEQQKLPDIMIEDVDGEKGIIIDIGKVSYKIQDSDIRRQTDTVIVMVLSNTEHLCINSFPTTGVDGYKVMRLMMEHSSSHFENQLWCYTDKANEFIFYICPSSRMRDVDTLIQRVTGSLQVIEKRNNFEIVLSKVFISFNVKQVAKSKFNVTLAIDCLETENKCYVTIKGCKSEVDSMEAWLKHNYIDQYVIDSISFNDIKKRCGHNIDLIVEDVFFKKEHAFWFVNDSSEKIFVCTQEANETNKMIHLLKNCLRSKTCPGDKYKSFLEMEEVKDGRVVIKRKEGRDELEVIGIKTLVDEILSRNCDEVSEKLHNKPLDREKESKTKQNGTNSFGTGNKIHEVDTKYSKEKTDNIEIEQKLPIIVKDSNTYKTLKTSAELQIFVDGQNVRLENAKTQGFLIKGYRSDCKLVKEKLMKMISEYDKKSKITRSTETWNFPYGHQVIVKYPHYLETDKTDVDHYVILQEVPPEEANYDNKYKLNIPHSAEGKKKEKMADCILQLLYHCWNNNLLIVKLEIPKLDTKASKQFCLTLFEELNNQDREEKPPLTLYLCSDSKDVYEELVGNCDNCMKKAKASHAAVANLHKDVKHEVENYTDGDEMLTDQRRRWQDEREIFMKQPKSCECYVLVRSETDHIGQSDIKLIQNELSCAELSRAVIIPSGRLSNRVLLKCNSQEDAEKLLFGTLKIQGKTLIVEKMPMQSLHTFTLTSKEIWKRDRHEMQKIGICFNKENEEISLPTIYHLHHIEGNLGFCDTQRERKESEGFCSRIACSQEIWEIIQITKAEYLRNLIEKGITFSYDNGYFSVSYVKFEAPSLKSILGSILSLQKMCIIEVDLNLVKKKSTGELKGFCKSIDSEYGKECIVFIESKYSVIIFCDTYENLQKIRHQFLVRIGEVKVRARRGHRNLLDSEASVADVITKTVSSPEENSPKALIEHIPVSDIKRNQKKKKEKPEFSLENQARNLEKYTTGEGMQVLVYQADILKLPVDCIVNAANDSLQHGGGVARVIAQAAGRSLDTEGFNYIHRYGKVPVGKVCVTTAGKLHYDCVIHAVGPCWSDYLPHTKADVQKCEEDLYSAIMGSFLAAESRGLESIALPAISAAIFAVPVELCVYHYAKATIDYSRDRSPTVLKEIHFIDINPSIVSRIQQMFTIFLRDRQIPKYSSDKYVKQRNQSFLDKSVLQNYAYQSDTRDKDIPRNGKASDHSIITIDRDQCLLKVTLDNIMQVQASAIVSSEDLEGCGKGFIAKQIKKQINERNLTEFDREKRRCFGIRTKPGDVYAQHLFEPRYKYVLHAVIPYETRSSSETEKKKTIRKAFENVFTKLDEKCIDSVVMGLLGAGTDSLEDEKISSEVFSEAFTNYCNNTTRKEKLKLTLVCKNQQVFNRMKQVFEERRLIKKNRPPARPPPLTNRSLDQIKLQNTESPKSLETCAICMENITDRKELKCGHAFDKDCIDQAFTFKKVCPTCGDVCGVITGNQPEGTMRVNTQEFESCAGYERCGRITITYNFPSGRQGPEHQNPGKWYKGINRTAYLPDNVDGREVLELLRIAFERRLTFTIGSSRTTGQEGVITWNDIHHKTDIKPYAQFGYPDSTYFIRVKEELAAKGITPDQIPRQ